MKAHSYTTQIKWTGNTGNGTLNYSSYSRDFEVAVEGKPVLEGSSDSAFRGDKSKHNPEDLLVTSLSSCHMLWYLHLCAINKIVVLEYIDEAKGIMEEIKDGSGHFKEVTLYPNIIVKESSMIKKAHELHKDANKMCFIANSVNFPVNHKATIKSLE